jgi:hypothetical protein
MTRDVYEAIGGFDDELTYGGEEADVSLRAWLAGFSCCYVPSSLIGHVFKSKSQFPRSYKEEIVNRLRVAYKCLSDEEYKKVLKHNKVLFENAGDWGPKVFENAIAAARDNHREFKLARQEFQSRVVRPIGWFLKKFGIDL